MVCANSIEIKKNQNCRQDTKKMDFFRSEAWFSNILWFLWKFPKHKHTLMLWLLGSIIGFFWWLGNLFFWFLLFSSHGRTAILLQVIGVLDTRSLAVICGELDFHFLFKLLVNILYDTWTWLQDFLICFMTLLQYERAVSEVWGRKKKRMEYFSLIPWKTWLEYVLLVLSECCYNYRLLW